MSLPTLDTGDNNRKNSSGLPSMPPLEDGVGIPSIEMPSLEREERNDSLEDFEEVGVEDSLEEEDSGMNEEIYDDVEDYEEKDILPDVKKQKEIDYSEEDDYYPEYEEDLEQEKKDKFIDKKKKKLIPFGGNKSKKKLLVKSSDFDDRKNVLAKTKITQFFIISIIFFLFILGLKNTFIPSHVYTESQIKDFAAQGAGKTGFPEERGRFFVENFMETFLTLDKTDPTILQSLGYYYGKENMSNSGYSDLNMSWSNDTLQKIVISPKVYEIKLLTDYSAQYKVSAYVTNVDGEYSVDNKLSGRWLDFSVNLYYDKEKDSLSITQDSPTIIPSKNIKDKADIPYAKTLGNGVVNEEMYKAISPTIDGFIESFAKSSLESHNSVIQYIHDKNDIKLYDGFGGAVVLKGQPESSIKKTIYNSGDNSYEAEVTVEWIDAFGSTEEKKVSYISKYQMGITTAAEGKFVVTYFKPFEYFKADSKE